MIDVHLIRAVYPHGTMKELARVLSAPLDTARALIYRNIPRSRHHEIASALLADLDRQIADLRTLKTRIERVLEETSAAVARGRDPKTRQQARKKGEEADRMVGVVGRRR